MQRLKQNIPEARRANLFRRAWNRLTEWEKSPVLTKIEEIRTRRAERLIGEQKWEQVMRMGRGAVPALIGTFENMGPIKSMNIVWALVGIGTPAIRGLVGALKDEDDFIREFSAKALAEIAKKKPKYKWDKHVPALMKGLEYGVGKGARANVATLLGEVEDARALPALILALKDDDTHVMTCARDALVKKGKPAIDALYAALGNEDPEIRAHAAWAISGMKSELKIEGLEVAVPTLIGLLGDGNHEVQRNACDALRYVGDSSAILPLYELMMGKDSSFLELPAGKFVELMEGGGTRAGEIVKARGIIAGAVLALEDLAKRHPDYAWEPMLPGFLKLVESNDAWLQQIASGALGSIAEGHPEYEWSDIAPKVARTLCVDRGRVGTQADKALVKMGMVSAKPLILVMNNEHAAPWAASALTELAKKHAEDVAKEIIKAVNGKFGETLQEISTANGMAVQNLSDILLECGKRMENATS